MHKKILLPAAVAVAITAGNTWAAFTESELHELGRQSEAIQENAGKLIDEDWLNEIASKGSLFKKEAQHINLEATESVSQSIAKELTPEQKAELDKGVMEGYKYLIFASFSLGEAALKDIFISAAGHSETAVVFRGIPEGLRIDEAMYQVQAIAKQVEPIPNVILDPALFRENGVTVVPTLVVRDKNKKTIASVRGLHNPQWLAEQVELGKTGDLGFLGPAELIAERDLTEVMMERAQAINWEEKKEGAVKRAWANTHFAKLQPASEDRVRQIPASLRVTEDIITADGQVVAREGDIINPLELRPFTTAYIVFNPNRKGEVEYAIQTKKEVLAEGKYQQVVYMFTELDVSDDGWKTFQSLTDKLDAHAYNLMPEIQSRFAIEKTPSLITADSHHFIVTETHINPNLTTGETNE